MAKLLIFLEKPRFHFLCNTSQRESVGNKLNNVDSDCGEDSPPVAAGLQHCWHLGPGSVGEEAEACRQAARLLGPHVGATRPHQEGLVVRCQALWPGGNCPLALVFLQLGPVLTWAAARCTAKTLWTDGLSVASVWQGGGGSVGPGPWEVGYFRCVTFGAGDCSRWAAAGSLFVLCLEEPCPPLSHML